ncbi:hypothetical protein NSK_008227 [Nannochloropsis salina CCMP1776]|uniref:Uncharacterized protein n=1 Tax=Nannochloropsis salina CCMP1776 TaxID=1027361 RepID=A0A4D9CP37_9STRA|nr:hypothetical protein NSK_008227 [Nannochloropsis salina CCMP1776]|eukprot:TFJ80486.1 hypothetical protein NSK_008227 [Nannochloropsis salina CCMP1776]
MEPATKHVSLAASSITNACDMPLSIQHEPIEEQGTDIELHDQQQKEALCFAILEHFPTMVFAKDADPRTRMDDQTGFRYVYFNALMDHASGFNRLDMIGQNALNHFNSVDARQYFLDDHRVMALSSQDPDAVLDFYEPWQVPSGKHVNHTRKRNLQDAFMLGTFLIVDEVHTGLMKNRLFCHFFGPEAAHVSRAECLDTLVTSHLLGLNHLAEPGLILEWSNVALGEREVEDKASARGAKGGKGGLWHIMQRRLGDAELGKEGVMVSADGLVLVYVLWPQGDEGQASLARVTS